MKNVFLTLVLLFSPMAITQMNAQITIGTIVNDVPTLTMTDAELTSSLAFVLNNATLSNSSIQSGVDTLGQYYYVKATGTRPNQANASQIAIILSQQGNNLVFITTGDDAGCTMECNAGLPCTTCDQVIFEKCKSQRCKCASESGGCNSSVTFPN